MYQEKKEGGKCSCGATFVKNPKTGKIFCEQKCWLKGQTSTQPNVQVEEKPDWDRIRAEKTENIRWMNALNNACLLVANGKMEMNDLEALANRIYKLEPQSKVEPF